MADDQDGLKPTEFQVNLAINIEAKDVVGDLGANDTIQFIEELDEELDSWEVTILLARHFHNLSKEAPTELLMMTIEQLEDRLDQRLEVANGGQ